jgi:predicted nucleotidyltransferase
MVPKARFTEFLADIEPSSTTKTNSSKAHDGVRSYLRSHPTFKDRVETEFLAGSYARDTAIRPRTSADGIERPDIDIIVVTNFFTHDRPDDVLQELSNALDDAYIVKRINKRSVRVITSNAEIDVVPVVVWGTAYQLPDRDLGYWKATNPPEHINWSARQNKDFSERFKPLVKLLKWWRRENQTGKRPKSFVLEVLVSLHAPQTETHYGEAFAQMLENIYAQYGTLAALGLKPTISDPALPGSDILSKVTVAQWQAFIERARVHAGYARRAQDESDMEEATRLWRKLFGNRFPATSSVAKASSLAGYATAPAVAATGYTFPNAMAAPTKPRGFA